MRFNSKTDRGVAGLTILLSFVVFLFVIGLLVMLFSLTGSELQDATYTSTSATVSNEAHLNAEIIAGDELDGVDGYRNPSCTISSVANQTAGGTVLLVGNYTATNCDLANATEILDLDAGVTQWVVNYTFTYDADNTATWVMGNTTESLANTTDWFDIFIVIIAMVVLILLTVIIISAIRGSGLMGRESA